VARNRKQPQPPTGSPWCESCNSFHPSAKTLDHWKELQCFAPWFDAATGVTFQRMEKTGSIVELRPVDPKDDLEARIESSPFFKILNAATAHNPEHPFNRTNRTCPKCGEETFFVTRPAAQKNGSTIRERRCKKCGHVANRIAPPEKDVDS